MTPSLDRLAREGTRFASAFAPMPCTLPSHTALFTGLSPRTAGIESNFERLSPRVETLAERLQAEGFATAAFFNQFPFAPANLLQGVQTFENDSSEPAQRIVPALREWLALPRKQQRWFAWIHLFIPHGPLHLPDDVVRRHVRHEYAGPLRDDFETMLCISRGDVQWPEAFVANYRDRYDAAVALADQRLGEIRGELERAGQLDSTLVACLADHGESLERGILGLHAPVLRDVTLHVPLLLRGPTIPAARTVDATVQIMDLLPTLLSRLGFEPPPECEGRDLGPLLVDADAAGFDGPLISMLPTKFSGREALELAPAHAVVRRGRFKLVLLGAGGRELYDLSQDPDETRDLSQENADLVRILESAYSQWSRSPRPDSSGAEDEGLSQAIHKLGY